jgi:hypothetical protein
LYTAFPGDTNSDEDFDPTGIFEPTEEGVVFEGKVQTFNVITDVTSTQYLKLI